MTPLEHYPQLAKTIGLGDLFFKRDDLHPYGSHKGRSMPVMIDHYVRNGETKFAISSSGNAALAAALHIKEKHRDKASLDVFVGNHIAPSKLSKIKSLEEENIRILTKERPLQALTQAIKQGYRSLRQSTDDLALLGYKSLAQEILEEGGSGKIGAVFIGTSSGTTAQALADFFIEKDAGIQVHIVQTSSCHPIFDAFDSYDGPDEERSLADAIVDQTAFRKDHLVELIGQTGGRGWCTSNEEIISARDLVQKHTGLEISANSALSVVGAIQAAYIGYEIDGAAVCMICGE